MSTSLSTSRPSWEERLQQLSGAAREGVDGHETGPITPVSATIAAFHLLEWVQLLPLSMLSDPFLTWKTLTDRPDWWQLEKSVLPWLYPHQEMLAIPEKTPARDVIESLLRWLHSHGAELRFAGDDRVHQVAHKYMWPSLASTYETLGGDGPNQSPTRHLFKQTLPDLPLNHRPKKKITSTEKVSVIPLHTWLNSFLSGEKTAKSKIKKRGVAQGALAQLREAVQNKPVKLMFDKEMGWQLGGCIQAFGIEWLEEFVAIMGPHLRSHSDKAAKHFISPIFAQALDGAKTRDESRRIEIALEKCGLSILGGAHNGDEYLDVKVADAIVTHWKNMSDTVIMDALDQVLLIDQPKTRTRAIKMTCEGLGRRLLDLENKMGAGLLYEQPFFWLKWMATHHPHDEAIYRGWDEECQRLIKETQENLDRATSNDKALIDHLQQIANLLQARLWIHQAANHEHPFDVRAGLMHYENAHPEVLMTAVRAMETFYAHQLTVWGQDTQKTWEAISSLGLPMVKEAVGFEEGEWPTASKESYHYDRHQILLGLTPDDWKQMQLNGNDLAFWKMRHAIEYTEFNANSLHKMASAHGKLFSIIMRAVGPPKSDTNDGVTWAGLPAQQYALLSLIWNKLGLFTDAPYIDITSYSTGKGYQEKNLNPWSRIRGLTGIHEIAHAFMDRSLEDPAWKSTAIAIPEAVWHGDGPYRLNNPSDYTSLVTYPLFRDKVKFLKEQPEPVCDQLLQSQDAITSACKNPTTMKKLLQYPYYAKEIEENRLLKMAAMAHSLRLYDCMPNGYIMGWDGTDFALSEELTKNEKSQPRQLIERAPLAVDRGAIRGQWPQAQLKYQALKLTEEARAVREASGGRTQENVMAKTKFRRT